jgi:Ni,Fe-hydrogenase III small subunit
MAEAISVIENDELEDFHASIDDQGYDIDDFELTQSANPTPAGSVSVTGTVTVKRKSKDVKRTYPAGHDSAWPATFDDDLESGIFGKP